MQERVPNTDARERVLEAAERLFASKGYASVTLRDIAAEVGIRHTSLYHHVPGGKEELFIEVTKREFERHRLGLTQAIHSANTEIGAQLYAAADWLLSRAPVDLLRMTYTDMPAIDPAQARLLTLMAYTSIFSPIEEALVQSAKRGEIKNHNFGLITGALLGMIETLFAVPEQVFSEDMKIEATGMPLPVQGRQLMARELIDVMITGLRHHDSGHVIAIPPAE